MRTLNKDMAILAGSWLRCWSFRWCAYLSIAPALRQGCFPGTHLQLRDLGPGAVWVLVHRQDL